MTACSDYVRRHFHGTHVVRQCTPAEDQRMEALRIDGATLGEIAQQMGRPKSTIQVRLMNLARDAENELSQPTGATIRQARGNWQ